MKRIIKIFCSSIWIKPRLNVLQWAETYRVLSQESSSNYGRFKATSYQRLPLEVITKKQVKEVVLLWSVQLGKSEILNNILGFYMHQSPAPILFMLPTEDNAEDYSKRRLTPMFRDTAELGELITAKNTNNTILTKNFKGGNLALVGSNSVSKLASKPIKILIVDELDRCSLTKEGASADLARARTITFYDRKIILASTPTLKGSSQIEERYKACKTKFKFFIPCSECGHFQELGIKNITKFESDYFYSCEHCTSLMDELTKNHQIKKGQWATSREDLNKELNDFDLSSVGFFLNSLYSPYITMKEIKELEAGSKESEIKRQVFFNTILAKSYEPKILDIRDDTFTRLILKSYTSDNIHKSILFIIASVDVQKDRFEVEIRGWDNSYNSYGIKHLIIYGDTRGDEVFNELFRVLKMSFNQDGKKLEINLALIDSGYNATRVYQFIKLSNNFIASKGLSERMNKKDIVSEYKIHKGIRLLTVGVFKAKFSIFEIFNDKSKNKMYFCEGYEEEFFRQIKSEKLTSLKDKNGNVEYRFIKSRERNEALDLLVLNLAGYELFKQGLKRKKIRVVNADA